MPDRVDTIILTQLRRELSHAPQGIAAIREDDAGWPDLRAAVANVYPPADKLNAVLRGLTAADLDHLTSDGPRGDGAPNPATYIALRIEDTYGHPGLPE